MSFLFYETRRVIKVQITWFLNCKYNDVLSRIWLRVYSIMEIECPNKASNYTLLYCYQSSIFLSIYGIHSLIYYHVIVVLHIHVIHCIVLLASTTLFPRYLLRSITELFRISIYTNAFPTSMLTLNWRQRVRQNASTITCTKYLFWIR